MKFLCTIMLLVLAGKTVNAQIVNGSSVDMSALVNNSIFTGTFINPLDNILSRQEISDLSSSKAASFEAVGGLNRFLSIDWQDGGAVTYQNKTVRNNKYKFNFDYLSHQLLAKSGDTVIAVNPDHLKSFYITSQGKSHSFYKFPVIGTKNFVELLNTDTAANKLKLVKQRNVTLIKYTQANAGTALTGERSDIYQDEVNYFLLFPDNTTVKIKLNSKSLMEHLEPAYQSKAKELLSNNTKIDEDSLTKVIDALNSI